MITNHDIKKIIEDCAASGVEVKVREIAFVLLSLFFDDKAVAYRSVYQESISSEDVNKLYSSNNISYLRSYLEHGFLGKKGGGKAKLSIGDDLSFDENKAEMINLISKTEDAMKRGEVETKDGLKIIADLRVKLNDKFKVMDDSKDSPVVVETKYNGVCEFCGREIYVPTKEQLMQKYDLIERTQDEERNNSAD